MRKTTKDLVFETLARYENYEGPEEDLPYVVRVWRRTESLSLQSLGSKRGMMGQRRGRAGPTSGATEAERLRLRLPSSQGEEKFLDAGDMRSFP